jgi:hypothetical protein
MPINHPHTQKHNHNYPLIKNARKKSSKKELDVRPIVG